MFLDASVIVAILKPEADAEEQMRRLDEAGGPFFVSPIVKMEAVLSLARAKTESGTRSSRPTVEILRMAGLAVDQFIDAVSADEISISPQIGIFARDAAASYGKIVGHKAKLNLGDCFAYACAKASGLKIAYKGGDFIHTDLG